MGVMLILGLDRSTDVIRLETNTATEVFDKTVKLLPKPLNVVQEFLPFPQALPNIKPMGEICLLAEDELDPYIEYMVQFDQDDGNIHDVIGDMLTKQSLTLPVPSELHAGNVEIRVYSWRYGNRGPLLGTSKLEILPIVDYAAKIPICDYLKHYLSPDNPTNGIVDSTLANVVKYLLGSQESPVNVENPFAFCAKNGLVDTIKGKSSLLLRLVIY